MAIAPSLEAAETPVAHAATLARAGDRSAEAALVPSPAMPYDRRVETSAGAVLGARELEVLRLVAEGLQCKEMAPRLGVSQHTIKSHIRHILAKLEVHSRAHAVTVGFSRGYLRLPPEQEEDGPAGQIGAAIAAVHTAGDLLEQLARGVRAENGGKGGRVFSPVHSDGDRV